MEKLLMIDHVTEWGSLVWESHIETPWNAPECKDGMYRKQSSAM
jgi:hypothetical protein